MTIIKRKGNEITIIKYLYLLIKMNEIMVEIKKIICSIKSNYRHN